MADTIKRETQTVDATGKALGRLASEVAQLLRGKHKPSFVPHIDGGDFVVVKNISQLKFTGNKLDQKEYHRYTGYPGGIRTEKLKDLAVEDPEKLLKSCVRRMLPETKLRDRMLKRLTVQ